MRKVIKVTEEDIKNGIRENSEHCPIALATHRAFSEYDREALGIEVDDTIKVSIVEGIGKCKFFYAKDERIPNFVQSFDNGRMEEIEPFEMELDFIEEFYDESDEE